MTTLSDRAVPTAFTFSFPRSKNCRNPRACLSARTRFHCALARRVDGFGRLGLQLLLHPMKVGNGPEVRLVARPQHFERDVFLQPLCDLTPTLHKRHVHLPEVRRPDSGVKPGYSRAPVAPARRFCSSGCIAKCGRGTGSALPVYAGPNRYQDYMRSETSRSEFGLAIIYFGDAILRRA